MRLRRFLFLAFSAGLAAAVPQGQAKNSAPPSLKGLALGMTAEDVTRVHPASECGERLCAIDLPEGYTLAEQAATRAMIGLYRGRAVAISFELPQGSWEDVCRALRAHPGYVGWRYAIDEANGACELTAADRRWRFEVSAAADDSVVRITLIDVKGFNANQSELDRARAKDL